jgi:hypothetical protein
VEPKTAEEFTQRMEEIRTALSQHSTLVPVYHFTSRQAAECIIKGLSAPNCRSRAEPLGVPTEGLAMSTQGQGDGGVYFATKGPASLKVLLARPRRVDRASQTRVQIGDKEYEQNIIVACFGKERMQEYLGKGKVDVCIVYAIDPRLLQQAPVRDYARMVSDSRKRTPQCEGVTLSATVDWEEDLRVPSRAECERKVLLETRSHCECVCVQSRSEHPRIRRP